MAGPVAKKASFNFVNRVSEFMSSFSPRTLAYAGTAATLALVVQSAVLTSVVISTQTGEPGRIILQNDPNLSNQRAVVRFTANATLGDVTRFLDVNKAAVVHGPNRGGMYEIMLATSPMSDDDFNSAIRRMRAETNIVAFIAPKN